MRINRYCLSSWIILLLMVVMLESCSGCSHRGRRNRERRRERLELRETNDEREDRESSMRSMSHREESSSINYSSEKIASIAEGNDYDRMLDCLNAKVNDLRSLKNEYFRGNMPDKDVEARMKEIEAKYAPIEKALNDAQNEGLLTYNQHKRQMNIAGKYLKEAKSVFNRLGSDLSSSLDI